MFVLICGGRSALPLGSRAALGAPGIRTAAPQAARAELVLQLGHRGTVGSVAFSPDGKAVASGGEDGVILWDGLTGAMYPPLEQRGPAYSVRFSPDGQSLASGDGRLVNLWDM